MDGRLAYLDQREAELDSIRLTDDQTVSKRYDLTGLDDLDLLLDELDAMLTAGRVSDAAVVGQHPPTPAS